MKNVLSLPVPGWPAALGWLASSRGERCGLGFLAEVAPLETESSGWRGEGVAPPNVLRFARQLALLAEGVLIVARGAAPRTGYGVREPKWCCASLPDASPLLPSPRKEGTLPAVSCKALKFFICSL